MSSEVLKPQVIRCKVCGDSFIWNVEEQIFYRDRGLQPPKRCPSCRRPKSQEASHENT